MPWIYDKPFEQFTSPVNEEDVDFNSPYNRKPKGTKHYNNYESRLALIRKNLSTADDRLEQHRIARLTNKKKPICDQIDIILHKTLLSEATAAKFAAKSGAAKKKDETRKSPTVKSSSGASRGGSISKKLRETSGMVGEKFFSGVKEEEETKQ